MCIVLVGGHERMFGEYSHLCEQYGYEPKIFAHLSARFNKSIGNPDGIVIFTNTASHKMVNVVLKEAKKKKIPVFRNHNSSATSLEETLKSITLKSA